MKKRNLFSIGAMRAGSTSIYDYLSQHPQIFVPKVKEPYFFLGEYIRRGLEEGNLPQHYQDKSQFILNKGKYKTLSAYDSLYENIEEAKYFCDCSHYLHHPGTAKIIYEYNPQAKIIISLRNPVDRIYSEYQLYLRKLTLSESFEEFIKKMLITDSQNQFSIKPHTRLEKGLYYDLLQPWINFFPEEQIKIILFEDLISYPQKTYQEIFQWLDVDSNIELEIVRAQRGGKPKNSQLIQLAKKPHPIKSIVKKILPSNLIWKMKDFFYAKTLEKQEMSQEMKEVLKSLYLPSICQLENLLQKNLSSWK